VSSSSFRVVAITGMDDDNIASNLQALAQRAAFDKIL
jgi:hypothetical protein